MVLILLKFLKSFGIIILYVNAKEKLGQAN